MIHQRAVADICSSLSGTVATLSFALILTFNGVMQTPTALPGFWIFMYRVSPLTYLIAGMCGNALHGQQIQCSSKELSVFPPPQGQTCGQYLAGWMSVSPGQLSNPSATTECQFCAFTTADQYMSLSKICKWKYHVILTLHDCSVAVQVLTMIMLCISLQSTLAQLWNRLGLCWI